MFKKGQNNGGGEDRNVFFSLYASQLGIAALIVVQ